MKIKACVWQTDHNICKHSLSAYRVHGQGWVGEAAKGRRRWVWWGRQCFSQLPLLMGTNDQAKWDHNGAHRNSTQALEHRTVILAKRGFRCNLTKEKLWMMGEEERKVRRWQITQCLLLQRWDEMHCHVCSSQKKMWSCVRNQKQEPRKTGHLSRWMTRRVQAITGQAATEALSVVKDKSWHWASPWRWSDPLLRGARQTWNITFCLQRFLSTSYTAPTIRDTLKLVCLVLAQCTTVLPLAQGQKCSPASSGWGDNESAVLFLFLVSAN